MRKEEKKENIRSTAEWRQKLKLNKTKYCMRRERYTHYTFSLVESSRVLSNWKFYWWALNGADRNGIEWSLTRISLRYSMHGYHWLFLYFDRITTIDENLIWNTQTSVPWQQLPQQQQEIFFHLIWFMRNFLKRSQSLFIWMHLIFLLNRIAIESNWEHSSGMCVARGDSMIRNFFVWWPSFSLPRGKL